MLTYCNPHIGARAKHLSTYMWTACKGGLSFALAARLPEMKRRERWSARSDAGPCPEQPGNGATGERQGSCDSVGCLNLRLRRVCIQALFSCWDIVCVCVCVCVCECVCACVCHNAQTCVPLKLYAFCSKRWFERQEEADGSHVGRAGRGAVSAGRRGAEHARAVLRHPGLHPPSLTHGDAAGGNSAPSRDPRLRGTDILRNDGSHFLACKMTP